MPHFALAPLDITNLYTNIPVIETRGITANTLENNKVKPQAKKRTAKLVWHHHQTKLHLQKKSKS